MRKVETSVISVPVFARVPVLLPLVLHHLGVVLKGELAKAASGGDLGALVDDLDVVREAVLCCEPLSAAVAETDDGYSVGSRDVIMDIVFSAQITDQLPQIIKCH